MVSSWGVLHELIPSARTIAFLTNPTNPIPTEYVTGRSGSGTQSGAEIHVVQRQHRSRNSIKRSRVWSQLRADALVVAPDAFFIGRRDRIVALAAERREHRDDIPISRIRRRRRPDEATEPTFQTHFAKLEFTRGAFSRVPDQPICRWTQPTTVPSCPPDQPHDGEGARHCRAVNASRPRRRGDRVRPAMSATGTSGHAPVRCTCPLLGVELVKPAKINDLAREMPLGVISGVRLPAMAAGAPSQHVGRGGPRNAPAATVGRNRLADKPVDALDKPTFVMSRRLPPKADV